MRSPSPALSRGHAALRGILLAGLGALLMTWPGITIGTVVVLIAVHFAVDAVGSIVVAWRRDTSSRDRALLSVRSLIELIAAGVVLVYPGVTAAIVAVVVGIATITAGGLELAILGRAAQAGVKPRGWALAVGLVSVVAGVALVVWPGIGAVTLALVFGAALVVAGVLLLVQAAVAPRGATVPVQA